MERGPEGSAGPVADELAAVTRAMAALENQRATLGDDVVETALAPLRQRRAELEAPATEERRLVTVVFSDLVDFTVLSRTLDAEDTQVVVNRYFARWQQAIEAQGGVVEKFIGDAVMAVFGLRQSYEDDAVRAVRAAVAMTEALPALSAEVEAAYGVALHMRVGVDSGEVVVSTLGERAGGDFVAVGPTVNRASRIQGAAPVDRVLVSADTHRQIRGRFSFEDSDAVSLKGIDTPVAVFLVGRERPQGFGVDPTGGVEGVENRTVGRDLQLGFLRERFADVTDERRWRVLTVVGEAGIGKSRLLAEFDAELMESPETLWWFRGRASPTTRDRSQGLLRDLMSTRLGVQLADSAVDVRTRLRDELARVLDAATAARDADVLGSWLGFELGDDLDVPADAQARRDQGTEVLGRYFAALARTAPVVVLLEDLHWADDGSLRWLDAADSLLAQSPVLVVATTRPTLLEERPHWGEGLEQHERLPLSGLSRRQARELARHLLGRVPSPPPTLLNLVVDAAEGNPFYLEELVTWLLDSGVVVRGDPDWFVVDELVGSLVVPSTLKGVLQSRMDALAPPERSALQRASVVGRVFWDTLLQLLTPDGETVPAGTLDTLRRREILLERESAIFGETREFLFKHALLRDVAYESLLRAHRERYHLRVAEWLAEASERAGRGDEYAAVVADHFARAGSSRAAGFYLRAGEQAGSVYALEEATRLLERAAALVDSGDRQLTFDVHNAREKLYQRLGDRDAQGHAIEAMAAALDSTDRSDGEDGADRTDSDDVRSVVLLLARAAWAFDHSQYSDAVALASDASARGRAVGRVDLEAEAELWVGKAHTWADQTPLARERLRRALELAESNGLTHVPAEAYRYLSMVASDVGEYADALELAENSRARFAAEHDAEGESTALMATGTICFNLGRVEDARAAFETALPMFRRAGHRYRIATALSNLASVEHRQGLFGRAQAGAAEAIEIMRSLDDREGESANLSMLGIVETSLGRFDAAVSHLEAAAEVAHAVPARSLETEALARLTLAHLGREDVDAALDTARRAGLGAAEALSGIDSGTARLVTGYALAAAGREVEARDAFAAAANDFVEVEVVGLERESRIGLAGVLSRSGSVSEAATVIRTALAGLTDDALSSMLAPPRALVTCVEVLRAADDPEAEAVAVRGQAFVRDRAARAGSDELADEYLAEPTHARVIA